MLDTLIDIPCWIQLPQRSFKENMYVQFSEGVPGLVIEEENRKISVDVGRVKDDAIAAVYEKYLAQDLTGFGLSKEYAGGFFEFLTQVKDKGLSPDYLKGHITGPVSFLLTVTDENKKPLIYQSQIADCVLKVLTMKARWQAKKLKKVSSNVVIFVDEPYLISIGSGYISLERQEVLQYINEVIEGIHAEGALAGIHCCGNTDWEFLTQTRTDIINFDAYNFSESLALYPQAIQKFLDRNGVIAWGVVPTTLDVEKVSLQELAIKLKDCIKLLCAKGIDTNLINSHSLITPSCGLGSLSPHSGEKILRTTQDLSNEMQKAYKHTI